jgi:hypothetical protein
VKCIKKRIKNPSIFELSKNKLIHQLKQNFMKNTIKIFGIVALFATVLFASCKKDETVPAPEANFAISPNDTLKYGETFTFTNTSTNADSYLWNFGDGTTSTAVNATKSDFGSAPEGSCYVSFVIALTASKNGKSSTVSKTVYVNYCE